MNEKQISKEERIEKIKTKIKDCAFVAYVDGRYNGCCFEYEHTDSSAEEDMEWLIKELEKYIRVEMLQAKDIENLNAEKSRLEQLINLKDK